MEKIMLEVNNLNVTYNGKRKINHIVRDISFSIKEGECVVILGESGSGKSMTMKAILGLLDNSFTITGKALLNEQNILEMDKENLRKLRGKDITMILQNPMTCFDTLYRVGYQMKETLKTHTNWNNLEIHQKSIDMLNIMQIKSPEEVLKKYPHQLSGGMLQRIMIGIALMLNPKILVTDEPTTAIDAITKFEVMKEFQRLKDNHTTMLFITHDLGVASLIADRVIVMNKGKIVDEGTFAQIISNPKDNYTRLLVEKRIAVMNKFKTSMEVVE
ncbi:nickel import ATP-binding protein NikD [Candidatus Epulonipiscioides gigas]|nr:nickel import ATP-binding protein NikD [Epulopiscium sp. SCG-C07WGA-EpuloA2]